MKNKYKLFNEIEIKDENHKTYIISQEEKENLFNTLVKDIKIDNGTNKKSYKKIAIASVLCLSISTIILSNDKVWALVENIGKQIESYLGKEENEYKGYKVTVNQVSEDQGIKASLYEVLLDDGNILLNMNLDSSKFDEGKLKNTLFSKKSYYLRTATVYMDGKKFVETGGATRYEVEKNKKQDFLTSLVLDRMDTTNDGIADITDYKILDNIDPNKDYNIKVVFDEVGVRKSGFIQKIIDDEFESIRGNWEFEFKVNGKKIIGETKIYNINEEIIIEDDDFKAVIDIKQLRISPISIKLTYTTKMGKGYEFENRNVFIDLLDQNEKHITDGGSGGGNKNQTYMEMSIESNLENMEDLKSIKILPYQDYREKNSNNPKYQHRIDYNDNSITIDLLK